MFTKVLIFQPDSFGLTTPAFSSTLFPSAHSATTSAQDSLQCVPYHLLVNFRKPLFPLDALQPFHHVLSLVPKVIDHEVYVFFCSGLRRVEVCDIWLQR